MKRRPLIGITTSFDTGKTDPRLIGRSILFVEDDYVQAVRAAGGDALILPAWHDGTAVLNHLDGILITGNANAMPHVGEDLPGLRDQHPVRYDSDAGWLRGALAVGMPILAVCRGMQMLNEHFGGTLGRLYPEAESARHLQSLAADQTWHGLRVESGSLLASALGLLDCHVNSFHRQGVILPGEGLRVTAYADDGVVEAIEYPARRFVMGVQFHPERLIETDPRFLGIIHAFTAAAEDYRTGSFD